MLSWSAYRLDESRADGALFSGAVLVFAGFTLWKHRRLAVLPGTLLLLGALACGFLPLILLAQDSTGWAPSLGGLADRAPLLSAAVLAMAVATWKGWSPRTLLLPLLAGGSAAAWMGLVQAFGWDPPGYDSVLSVRPAYPFAGPSHAIEVQLPLLLLGLGLIPTDPRGKRWTWILLLPIALQVGYLGSNAARLGLTAASIYLWWRHRPSRPTLVAALALVVAGELLRSLLGGESILPPDSAPRGVSVRKEIYLSAASHSLSHPMGIGIGRFESDYPEWRSAEEARLSSGNWKDTSHRIPKTPHQEILLPLVELGWIGFLLLGAAAARIWRARPTLPTDPMWIGFLTLAMFRSPFSDNPTALALAALVLGSEFAGTRSAGSHPRLSLLPVAMALLAVVPAWAQLRGERSVALAVQDQDHLEEHLLDALDARPWDHRSLVLLGSLYIVGQQWDAARDCFDSALVHNPTDLAALTAYIKVEMFAPDGEEVLMLRLLARAEQFAPFHPSVKQARILWLEGYRQAFLDEAVRRVQQGIPEAGAWWTATYLAEAYIAAVEEQPDEVRSLLFRASAVAPGGHKGLLERTADRPGLEPDDIAQLTRKVFPQWPRVTY